jgi:hypothetical protein
MPCSPARAKYDHWFVEFEAAAPRTVDPLMGWTSSADMRQQVKLTFPTKEEAIAYCEREGLAYHRAAGSPGGQASSRNPTPTISSSAGP